VLTCSDRSSTERSLHCPIFQETAAIKCPSD
jgi:hypothetical protein